MDRIEIGDFLIIAEAITGIDAKQLARQERTMAQASAALAAPFAGFGDVELFPSFAEKTAIYGSRIVLYHPLVDGNKRTARVVMREFVARNNRGLWWAPEGGWQEEAQVLEELAAGTMDETEFIAWVAERIA